MVICSLFDPFTPEPPLPISLWFYVVIYFAFVLFDAAAHAVVDLATCQSYHVRTVEECFRAVRSILFQWKFVNALFMFA